MSLIRQLRQLAVPLLPGCASLSLGLALAGTGLPALAQSSPYVGATMLFAGSYCPNGWFEADGRLLPISQYETLFVLLGTRFGGDGVTVFGLPDLRGRTPRGSGQGPGLSPVAQGQKAGSQTVQLSLSQLPAHNHFVTVPATAGPATHAAPATQRVLAATQNGAAYTDLNGNNGAALGTASEHSSSVVGRGEPIDIRAPYLGLRWCVAYEGIFPQQN